ncbi:MAG: SUMF1/EgtB/PvdO family nonheme iron enzyme [Verrucomicrobia bacterium]|nr:SUMF1/EgtB/PvdO family nonheme iron enzyme [Verrucomicrobiota bacterium]
MAELTGQTFAGFEVVAKLGEGGMGAVYKARQPLLDRFVALKVMSQQLSGDPAYVARFIREAASAAKLNHPNMVQVFTAGEQSGIYYIVMEFVEGESLNQRLKRVGCLDAVEAIAITLHVATALQRAWNEAQLIHRDIKPDNIFLSNKGEVKVGDLGLAKSVGGGATEMTQSGMMMGSPHYISPEQARASKETDFRADIYSLGCTLYQLLTGTTPYHADEALAVVLKHVTDPVPDILAIIPNCPQALAAVVGRMMSKVPDQRHASYEELIAELWQVSDIVQQQQSAATAALTPAVASKGTTLKPTVAKTATVVPTVKQTIVRDSKPVIRDSRFVIGGVIAVTALLLVGLFSWSPWKSRTDEQERREGATTGSESRLQAESLSGQPAKAGTPSTVFPADEAAWQNAINLLPIIDPEKDAVQGKWTLENGALRHEAEHEAARLQIPYQPPEEYDFRIVFAPQKARMTIWQILRGGGRTFQLVIGGLKPGANARCLGFEIINDKSAGENPSGVLLTPDLEIGRHYTSLVQVRKDGVRLFLDGRFMTEWKTDYQDMTMFNSRRLRDDRLLGIADSAGSIYHRIEVREVTGKGTFTRGAPSAISTTPSLQHSAASASGILAPPETRVTTLTTTPKVGEVYTLALGSNVTMELMGIPPGEFMMGSTKEEQAWGAQGTTTNTFWKWPGELVRRVILKNGLWLGRTEVAVGQWKQFVAATGYRTDAEKKGYVDYSGRGAPSRVSGLNWRDPGFGAPSQENHAVSCISWNDATAFCEWLNEREQRNGRLPPDNVVRLPTEAEWEYACRAGTQTKFWWGDSVEDGQGRLNWAAKHDGFDWVAPVDSFGTQGRNRFGLADMLGNLWELCLDEWDEAGAHDGQCKGDPFKRASRGGAYCDVPNRTRCAARAGLPGVRSAESRVGFRVAVGMKLSTSTEVPSMPPRSAPNNSVILAPSETRVATLTIPKVDEAPQQGRKKQQPR